MSSAQAPVPVDMKQSESQAAESALAQSGATKSNYKGFVAGVFSGIAKLSGEFLVLTYFRITLMVLCDSWTSVRHLFFVPSKVVLKLTRSDSIPSKFACRRVKTCSSVGRWIAHYRRCGMRVCAGFIRVLRRRWSDG